MSSSRPSNDQARRAFGALWGSDASSDFVRVVKAILRSRERGVSISIPSHADFSVNQEFVDGLCVTEPLDGALHSDLSHVSRCVNEYLDQQGFGSSYGRKDNELLIVIDNAFAQIDEGVHPPPPYNFYAYVLETRYWKRVTLIDLGGEHLSPVTQLLLRKYPRIKLFHGNICQAWHQIRRASNAVIGSSLMPQALSIALNARKRVWLPAYAQRDGFISSGVLQVNPIHIESYLCDETWRSERRQREWLQVCPPEYLRDDTRWEFTETERCRSFEFCQSCRNTGSEGKLWRSVIAQRFEVPSTDWDCPHGWKWGGKPGLVLFLKKKLKVGTVIKKTSSALGVKACVDCERRGQWLDGDRS